MGGGGLVGAAASFRALQAQRAPREGGGGARRLAWQPNHPPPLCDTPSGCCFFTRPWTVTRSALRMLRRVAASCRPLRPVLLLVSFPRSRSPVVGVPGLCWMRQDVPFARQQRPVIGTSPAQRAEGMQTLKANTEARGCRATDSERNALQWHCQRRLSLWQAWYPEINTSEGWVNDHNVSYPTQCPTPRPPTHSPPLLVPSTLMLCMPHSALALHLRGVPRRSDNPCTARSADTPCPVRS